MYFLSYRYNIYDINIFYPLKGRGGETGPALEQRYRDVLKKCVIRSYGKTLYMIYGIEAQSEIHYAMPVRSMLYDAINYASQVSEIAAEHRKEGDHGASGGEFLSGFHRADRLHPVQTLRSLFRIGISFAIMRTLSYAAGGVIL